MTMPKTNGQTNWQCRWSSTLGELESTHKEVWGTDDYTDDVRPTVFFGMYSLVDFYALWRHKGHKAILWAGSDIIHFSNGYWLDTKGKIRIDNKSLARWISKNCDNWVENQVEHEALNRCLVKDVVVCPSFLGDVSKFKVTYKYEKRPKVYCSVSGDNFEMYGWDVIEKIADKCNADFYMYGNTKKWISKHSNVIVRGRVPKEVMNEEIAGMQCGLRPLAFDGFSEVLAKSILMGQHPISKIYYPKVATYKNDSNLISEVNKLARLYRPNTEARNYYLKKLNSYPWKK